jgi:hypothetical protein
MLSYVVRVRHPDKCFSFLVVNVIVPSQSLFRGEREKEGYGGLVHNQSSFRCEREKEVYGG